MFSSYPAILSWEAHGIPVENVFEILVRSKSMTQMEMGLGRAVAMVILLTERTHNSTCRVPPREKTLLEAAWASEGNSPLALPPKQHTLPAIWFLLSIPDRKFYHLWNAPRVSVLKNPGWLKYLGHRLFLRSDGFQPEFWTPIAERILNRCRMGELQRDVQMPNVQTFEHAQV